MTAESSHVLISRVRLEGGANTDDLRFIERALTQLFTQLSRFDPEKVDIGLRFKDRGQLTDTKDALNDAESKVLAQLRSNVGRRTEHHPRRSNA